MSRIAIAITLALALFVVPGQARQQATALANLKTTAEASGFTSTSTHEDVMRFMRTVDEASPLIHMISYGTTVEGRDMPLAVVGAGLKDASPASVRATNRLRVHIQGNIHAGEVEGKEAALILLREFAQGQHADWLKTMVFLITPIFNADGNERFALTNRGRQNGPINGMGTRQQAQGLNINRDFMKLETPEARAFVKLWNDYDPEVGFDLHTSDGTTSGYYLTYAPPLHPNTSATILNIMKNEWFPFVTKQIKSKYNWDTFYYGNASGGGRRGGRGGGGAQAGGGQAAGGGRTGGGAPLPATVGEPQGQQTRGWATFEHVPRFHNNYLGLRNRFALLSEAYAYATFEDRIKATRYFVEEALNFAHANASRLKKAVQDADREAIAGKDAATRAAIDRTTRLVDIVMGEVEDEINPVNKAVMNRRKDVTRIEKMYDWMWFAPTATESVPAEFYVPANATKALELLRAHGVVMRELKQPVKGVEVFTIASNTQAPPRQGIDFGGHAVRTLTGEWKADPSAEVPAGSFAVAISQPLGKLAFYLLAPTSDDGLVNWNYLDELLGEGVTRYPVYRKK